MTKNILEIRSTICSDSLGSVLDSLTEYALDNRMNSALAALDSLKSTYRYLKQYLLTGYSDEKREALYRNLKTGAYEISSRMYAGSVTEKNRSLAQLRDEAAKSNIQLGEIEHTLAMYTAKMASEDRDGLKYYTERLYAYRKNVFSTLCSVAVLTPADEQALVSLLLSPATPAADSRITICALMLAQQVVFDMHRMRVLAEVCLRHGNDVTRQYALVALVLSRPGETETEFFREEIEEVFARLGDRPEIGREFLDTQLQLLICAGTEEAKKTIEKEILPILRENAENAGNGAKTEKELIDEILHPDKEEKAIEKMEETMERMRKMRDDGTDIFFAGFSRAKRYSFFYSLMNWFVPFDMDHPHISSLQTGEVSRDTVEKLMDTQNFCDSDKYSFILTFSNVVRSLPPQLLEVIKKGEMDDGLGGDVVRDKSYWRLLFMQDLYRFYTLYPMKENFTNPFASEDGFVFFTWEPVNTLFPDKSHLLYVARRLLRRGCFKSLDRILDGHFDEMNVSYLKLKAMGAEKRGKLSEAMEWFKKALAFEPENLIMIRRMASIALKTGDYALAKRLYSTVISMAGEGEDTSEDEFRYAGCCLYSGDTKRATDTLYKLTYLHEDNVRYKETLAMALMQAGRLEDALKTCSGVNPGDMGEKARVRGALALWLSHDRKSAVAALKSAAKDRSLGPRAMLALMEEQNGLCGFGICGVDLCVINDLAFDDTL